VENPVDKVDNSAGAPHISSVFGIRAVENPVDKVENPENNAFCPPIYVNL